MAKQSRSNRVRSADRVRPAERASPPSGAAQPRRDGVVDGIIGAGLVLLVAVVYLQTLRFDFVNYDDTAYVPENRQVRDGCSLGGVGWAFTTFETANWYPLTWLSLMLDCQVFGPWPGGHHAVNAALHAANAVLLFLVLWRMTAARWRSAAVAALFAVHPLHVESVAWIAERKDVLSTLFFLLTLWAYQGYVKQSNFRRGALVFLSMALGLMSKAMLVTLPGVLFLLDFWPLRSSWEQGGGGRQKAEGGQGRGEGGRRKEEGGRRKETLTNHLENRDLQSLISDRSLANSQSASGRVEYPACSRLRASCSLLLPLLALSLTTAAVTLAAQASKGATAMLHDQAGPSVRLANAAIAYVWYLRRIIWPADLAVYYPYDFHPSTWPTVGAALLLLLATAAAVCCIWQSSRRRVSACGRSAVGPAVPTAGPVQKPEVSGGRHTECGCYLAVGWLWYVGTLVPVIGLVQVGSQAMADRYGYIPSIGVFLAIVWAAADLARWLSGPELRRIALVASSSAILAVLLVVAHRQASYWIDSEQLFLHALAITGDNPVACENLGDALLHQARYAEAEAQFRKVLAMDAPHNQQTPPELAQALQGQGRLGELMAVVRETISEKSARAAVLNNLALFLAIPPQNRVAEAIQLLREAIELVPQQPLGPRNLAWIYATCPDGRFRNGPKAVELARRACELSQWKNAFCRQTLADAYLESGDRERAIAELQAVIRLSPQDAAAGRQLESLAGRRH